MKLLIIEDEKELLQEIEYFLKKEDFICETADNYEDANEKISMYQYDMAIIDITLPGGSGLDLIRTLKTIRSETGIIIVSAKNSLDDKLRGLSLGADDYITKPFHLAELNARINAVLRRRKMEGSLEIEFNEVKIVPENGDVLINNHRVNLTKKEYQLLIFLIVNKNRLLTKETIAGHLWGDDIEMADNFDFIYTHINNLRQKIMKAGGTDYIRTVYGMGYKFTDK